MSAVMDIQVQASKGKGLGVFANRPFRKGEFVCEYKGEILDLKKAKERENKYEEDEEVGSYMSYFKQKDETFWYVSHLTNCSHDCHCGKYPLL